MADNRFKQFAISDSDEDSSDEEVLSRRDQRAQNSEAGPGETSAAASPLVVPSQESTMSPAALSAPSPTEPPRPPPAETPTESPMSAAEGPSPSAKNAESPEVAAPEDTNHSSLSFEVEGRGTSRNVTDGHSIVFESVEPTPAHQGKTPEAASVSGNRGSLQRSMKESTTSISFRSARGSAAATPVSAGRHPSSGATGAAHPIAVPTTRGKAAPTPAAADANSEVPSSRLSIPIYAIDGSNASTPKADAESAASAASGSGRGRKRKVVRKRVVVRRKKGSDPNTPGEVVSEEVLEPSHERESSAPPARLSPRAARAASSRVNTPRSTSVDVPHAPVMPAFRAETPRTPRTPRAGVERGAVPLVPGRRTASEVATPRTDTSSIAIHEAGTATTSLSRRSRRAEKAGAPAASAYSNPDGDSPKSTSSVVIMQPDEESLSFQLGTATSQSIRIVPERELHPRARAPKVPPQSALMSPRSEYEMDDEGNVVRIEPAHVQKQVKPDGRVVWMLVGQHRGDAGPAPSREIPAPPRKLSQRAQDIMAAKRRAVEQSAKQHFVAPKNVRRPRLRFNFPVGSYYSKSYVQRHLASALAAGDTEWTVHRYDGHATCQRICEEAQGKDTRYAAEKVVRTIQPIQVGVATGSTPLQSKCSCVVYEQNKEELLGAMLRSDAALEEGFKRYLNLQPMQLANVEVQDMMDHQTSESPAGTPRASIAQSATDTRNPNRGIATLGGLWCTVEALREDGRPAIRKDAKAPRRVMRVCGGPALGLPLREEGQTLDVRCYELLLFPQESISPSAVNYGAEGLSLGQLVSPPASSFPLTPRIVDDPITLKEYKRKLISSKGRAVALQNGEDDRITFFGNGVSSSVAPTPTAGGATTPTPRGDPPRATTPLNASAAAAAAAPKYLTVTLVTLNARQKYTIDLTLVMLPYRANSVDGGKTLAEVPRFCPATVAANRRLQGISLSFSTRSSFMSAYKALLWATECNIIDIQPLAPADLGKSTQANQLPYANLRISATPSPLLPWSTALGKVDPSLNSHDTFHGSCVDFAVITLSASPTLMDSREKGYRDALTLDDFVIEEYNGDDEGTAKHSGDAGGDGKTVQVPRRRSAIFTSTLPPPSVKNSDASRETHTLVSGDANAIAASADGANSGESSTIVGLTAFGVIRRAVSQVTSEVFDVRVLPRNRARVSPAYDEESNTVKTVKMEEEQLLQQDVEAAIMLEYTSRLPFQSRIYGVLVDEQRYYVFQEPWISALALEEAAAGTAERDALDYNETLKNISSRTSVMSLTEFIHGVLRPETNSGSKSFLAGEEAKLQISQVLLSQMLLLIASLHGKGTLLGPCPPHRLLVRVETPRMPDTEEDNDDIEISPDKRGKSKAKANPVPITSKNVQLCVLDVGVNTYAWSYERQQCGVLEYIPPSYVFEYMLGEDIGKESRAWTMLDDWWSFLCVAFEVLAADGSALVRPREEPLAPGLRPTPIISKFSSPVDILNIWRDALTNTQINGNTVSETVAARTREFVRTRVLESIAPMLDGWIAHKAEELEYFGTTAGVTGATRRKSSAARAVPPTGGSHNKMHGVSLASVYFQGNYDSPSNASTVSAFQFLEEGSNEDGKSNVLKEMPWIFSYRDLFDSILDVIYPEDGDLKCAVHGPSLHLFSHPFFSTLSLGAVFDGTQKLPPAASQVICSRMTKSKVKAALLAFRTRAYRGPMPKRAEYPLMITGSAFNVSGGDGAAALLLLTSPATREELSTRELDREDIPPSTGADFWRQGLVYSPANSVSPSAIPSPRARSPGTTWGARASLSQVPPPQLQQQQQQQGQSLPSARQARLRSMYPTDELQSIAQLETEVRGALSSHFARDPSLRRELDIPTPKAVAPIAAFDQQPPPPAVPPIPIANEQAFMPEFRAAAPATRASSKMSSYQHTADEYQTVGNGGSVLAPPTEELQSSQPAPAQRSGLAPYQQTSTTPYVESSVPGTPHKSGSGRRTPLARQNSQHNAERVNYSEIEQSLNEFAQRPNRVSRTNSNVSGVRPGGGVTRERDMASRGGPGSAYEADRHSNTSQTATWPQGFLENASLQKKGSPAKLSDPLASDAGGAQAAGRRTPASVNAGSGHESHLVLASEPHRRVTHQRTTSRGARRANGGGDEESIVLVPSGDDESDGAYGSYSAADGAHSATYQSGSGGRRTPASRKGLNPKKRKSSADSRDAYFEF